MKSFAQAVIALSALACLTAAQSAYGGDNYAPSSYGNDYSQSAYGGDDTSYGGDDSDYGDDSAYGGDSAYGPVSAYGTGTAAAASSTCSQDGQMTCSGTGFNTCNQGSIVYRDCGPGTACRPNAGSIVCDYA